MIVPIVTAVTISTACTRRKDVGLDWPMAPDQARWSFQIAIANRGQITQLKAPASTRNTDQLRERITPSVSRRVRRPAAARTPSGGEGAAQQERPIVRAALTGAELVVEVGGLRVDPRDLLYFLVPVPGRVDHLAVDRPDRLVGLDLVPGVPR